MSNESNGGDGTITPHLSIKRYETIETVETMIGLDDIATERNDLYSSSNTYETTGLDDIATEQNELFSLGEESETIIHTEESDYSVAGRIWQNCISELPNLKKVLNYVWTSDGKDLKI